MMSVMIPRGLAMVGGRMIVISLLLLVLASSATAQELMRPVGWTDASHGNNVPANYDLVLPDDRINEIYITFTSEAWQAEEQDMLELHGERGAGGARGRGSGEQDPGGQRNRARFDLDEIASIVAEALERSVAEVKPATDLLPDVDAAAVALGMEVGALNQVLGVRAGFAQPHGGNDGQPTLQFADRNPIWVPVTIQFGEQTWWEVGFRYKGNSTLSSGWRSGTAALPFKLDFDEFEDEHPELDNQRFYGFKQLSFGASDFDASLQREKVTADIFRDAGVPAAETAFYAVYVDNGDGDGIQYWGIYTAVELPDDTLIETQFDEDNGNMYKPEGSGATFAADSFSEASFDKETNGNSDYYDVLTVFDALHADSRLNDPAAWRSDLEAVFDVDGFLLWLATNTLLQNWDTYGIMSHNYYLYADEGSGRLVWIPWDNNEALSSRSGPPRPAGETDEEGRGPGGRGLLSLSLESVDTDAWPLIGFLLEDAAHASRYLEFVDDVSANVFTPQRMEAIYEANYQMLAAYVGETEGEGSVAALRAATDALVEHVYDRSEAAETFLAQQQGA